MVNSATPIRVLALQNVPPPILPPHKDGQTPGRDRKGNGGRNDNVKMETRNRGLKESRNILIKSFKFIKSFGRLDKCYSSIEDVSIGIK